MELAPEVVRLAWLVGSWHGTGTLGYPNVDATEIDNDIVIASDGGPYLSYTSTVRVAGDVWAAEAGFFRVPARVNFDVPDGASPVELLISDPAGYVTVYIGIVRGQRIDLGSDLVARTESGADVSAGRRMYGLVESELMWAWDLAAFGHPLQSYLAARLSKADT